MDKYFDKKVFPLEFKARFQAFPPLRLVAGKERYKEIDGVFLENEPVIDPNKQSLILFHGPSGSGKDSAMKKVIELGKAAHVVTATTRAKRDGEAEDEYMWIDNPILDGENPKAYELRIASQYNLVEHDGHHGAVYGLPRSNIDKFKGQDIVGIIRTETNGVKTIQEKLAKEFNLITVFISADSYEVLAKRINGRNNFAVRMEKSTYEIEEVLNNRSINNFIIMNPENPNGQKAGEEEVAEKMNKLFDAVFHPNEG